MAGASVTLRGLRRHYPGAERPSLDSLDLDLARGEVLCLVGPSGCGKSTTLRLVAGLEQPDAGEIRIDGRDMSGIEPQSRDVAMVFQGFALYPHMTVQKNLEFPLRMRKVPKEERARTVLSAAERLGLGGLLKRFPAELSGGERQRVAMGRAIVRKPKVFLFDEPLSNLDAALRADLRIELARLLRELDATALYVTHDQVEAMTLGHRIAVLRAGRLEQVDTPRRIYEAPATSFVATFFGAPPMNLFEARRSGDCYRAGPLTLACGRRRAGETALVGVRPEHVRISGREASPDEDAFEARVTGVEPLGAESHVELEAEGLTFRARMAGFGAPDLGTAVSVSVAADALHWFEPSTGRVLESG